MISTREWFRNAFDDLYLTLYGHRNVDEARLLMRWLAVHLRLDGARVLDLGSGAARFHEPVIGRGASHYLGLDLSAALLRVAAARHPRPLLVRADMRRLPLRPESHDVVLSMFTSFGYFATDEENRAVISEVFRVLSPGGRFVADLLNPVHLRATLVPEGEREVEGLHVHELRRIEGDRVVKTINVRDEEGTVVRTYDESVRLIPPATMEAWAAAAGFERRGMWGGYDEAPFDEATSPRVLFLFEREGA